MDLVSLISNLTQYMEAIIIVFAIMEAMLLVFVVIKVRQQQSRLSDSYKNLTKGFEDIPDVVSNQSLSDQCNSMAAYVERKIIVGGEQTQKLKRNAPIQLEKNSMSNTFSIEAFFSVSAAFVQIFPLLGILGTILALGQIDFSNGTIRASDITSAFVVAIDTTILGMFFAIVFMILESRLAPTVQRIISDTSKAHNIFSRLAI